MKTNLFLQPETSMIKTFTSKDGKSFTMFAKSKGWDSDLYEDLVEPYFKSGMYVETWMDGQGKVS